MLRIYKLKSSFPLLLIIGLIAGLWITATPVLAQPFGVGIFNANVPFSDETSLSIATSGDVAIALVPSDSGTTASSSNTVTVTSSDVVGYKLYIRALGSTDLVNGVSSFEATNNVTPAALATNTWGYNLDNSSDFIGINLNDQLLKEADGPFTSGDDTNVYYGVNADFTAAAGSYSGTVLYTAVPQTT